MKSPFGISLFGAVLGLSLLGAPAHAAPVKLTVALKNDFARARQLDPAPFVNVATIVSAAPSAHEKARGRRAPIAQQLARLGPAATLPMLEKLTEEQSPVVRRDLIEALGLVGDARSTTVLGGIVRDATEDAETTRTTAEALARIGTDDAATHLLGALDASSGARTRAVLAGMGELRKVRITEAIAARVRTGDDDTVRIAARSLGRAGNAWAWKTLADKTEETRIRETAAKALVAAFVAHTGEARTAASNALMVVDAAITPSLIADARATANAETQTALDQLADRFAHNPSR